MCERTIRGERVQGGHVLCIVGLVIYRGSVMCEVIYVYASCGTDDCKIPHTCPLTILNA